MSKIPEDLFDNQKTVVQQYLDCYEIYKKEYTRLAVLMQVGSFYEIYQYKKQGNIHELTHLLNIIIAKKKFKSNDHVLMAGFGIDYVAKWQRVLVEHNYTTVIIDQLEDAKDVPSGKVKRGNNSDNIPFNIYNSRKCRY